MQPLSPVIEKLSNNLRIATDTNTSVESVTVSVMVGIGARFENEANHGVSHFLEHMAFKGTDKRTAKQIAEAIDEVGGSVNAYTSKESTCYYIKILKDDVELAFDILSDILLNSKFDPEEIERERQVILQELANSLDTPDDVVFDYFFETLYGKQPIGMNILGTKEAINRVDRDMLKSYIDNNYHAGNIVISVSGNVEHDRVLQLTNKYFSEVNASHDVKCEKSQYAGGDFSLKKDDLVQTQYILGYEGFSTHADDRYIADIASSVLGGGMSSRLFQEIREKRGLVYTISAFHNSFSDSGVFGVYAGTTPDKIDELHSVIESELKNVADKVHEHELKKTVNQYKAALLMSLESSSYRARRVAYNILSYDRFVPESEIMSKVIAISTADVQKFIGNLLSTKRTKVLYGKLN